MSGSSFGVIARANQCEATTSQAATEQAQRRRAVPNQPPGHDPARPLRTANQSFDTLQALALSEQAAVDVSRLLRWLESEALVEEGAEALVSVSDRFAEPERAFRLHCESPERLV